MFLVQSQSFTKIHVQLSSSCFLIKKLPFLKLVEQLGLLFALILRADGTMSGNTKNTDIKLDVHQGGPILSLGQSKQLSINYEKSAFEFCKIGPPIDKYSTFSTL